MICILSISRSTTYLFDGFDPANDWIDNPGRRYLTWRAGYQLLPQNGAFCGVVTPSGVQEAYPGALDDKAARWALRSWEAQLEYSHSQLYRVFEMPVSWDELECKLQRLNHFMGGTYKVHIHRMGRELRMESLMKIRTGWDYYIPRHLSLDVAWRDIRAELLDHLFWFQSAILEEAQAV